MTIASLLCLSFSFVTLAILMPLLAKFGMTRAMSFLPLVFCLLFVAVGFALSGDSGLAVVEAAMGLLANGSLLVLAGLLCLVTFAVFVAGSWLSARLYETREF